MQPLGIAIVGLDRHVDQVINCLLKSDRLNLCAVCETQPPLLNRYRERYEQVTFYDDPREMVLRAKPDILLLWRNDFGSELILSAIEKDCWVVLRPPINGGLSTAARLINQADKRKVGMFVWTPWIFLPCYEGIQDWLGGQQIRSFECRSVNTMADLELGDQEPLLSVGMYPYLFLSQRWLGLPEQIYCRQLLHSGQSTESLIQFFASATLSYPQALGTVTLGINTGPVQEHLCVTSSTGQIHTDQSAAHLFDSSGRPVADTHRYQLIEARQIAYTRHLERVWQSRVEEQRSTDFDLKSHLGVLAILETASLSTRTGHPEQLRKVADMANIDS